MGGIGKTKLTSRLTQQLAQSGQFKFVVWRSLRQAPPLEALLIDLIQAIAPEQLPQSNLGVTIDVSLTQLRSHRYLLILDNVEAILSGNELVGSYRSGYEDYSLLFQQFIEGRHQSTVLLTSRELPVEIATAAGTTALVRWLQLTGLAIEDGEKILAAKGLVIEGNQPQVHELIDQYQGNPLALKMVGSLILDLLDGDISAFLAQASLLFTEIRTLLDHQFNRLSLLEQQMMYWLAINREAVSQAELQADLLPSVTPVKLRDALQSLHRRSLVEILKPSFQTSTALMRLNSIRYTQQPVVMEYVVERLIDQICQEINQAQIVYLRSHALLKARAKDYVQEMQIRLIVQPILTRLQDMQGGAENLKRLLLQLLESQRLLAPLQPGYFAGNAINLLRQLGADLSHLNFSKLTIWQADLRTVNLHGTDFSSSDLSHSIFTQSMTEIMTIAFSPDGKLIATGD